VSRPLAAGLLAGWGAGVAAPWPVPVAVIVAAVEAQRAGASPATGAVCAGIGLGCILGTTGELAIIVNLAASAAGVLIQQVVASHVEFGREVSTSFFTQ
jgi:hypothetical protein